MTNSTRGAPTAPATGHPPGATGATRGGFAPRANDPAARQTARAAFQIRFPEWASTRVCDELRAEDFGRLDRDGHVYLDFTGGGLYGESQIRDHSEFMISGVYGNPHSHNPASLLMTEHVEDTRARVLEFFSASPDEYTVVFTPNASGALKLVGESYPFRHGGRFALTADNHNSVNGIREYASARRAKVTYVPLKPGDLRLDQAVLDQTLAAAEAGDNLFAFPAQSNFSGVKHDLGLVARAQSHGWDVLLDAAAFAPTSPLDIGAVGPDFVALSFYKMFGYPTGIGALIARRSKLARLERPWFAGGTIQIASVAANDHFLAPDEAGFEDGTVNYLMLPAIRTGLDYLGRIGMATIATRVGCLTGWLLDELGGLAHSNGAPLVKIHGPSTTEDRGGTITMTVLAPDGRPYSGSRIEALAADHNISIRTGCFCNPGAGESAHRLDHGLLMRWFDVPANVTFQQLAGEIRQECGKEISAIRLSVGAITTFDDVYTAMGFFAGFADHSVQDIGLDSPDLYPRDSA